MLKKYSIYLTIALLISACGTAQSNNTSSTLAGRVPIKHNSAYTAMQQSKHNASAKDIVVKPSTRTKAEENFEKGFLALSIIRVAATPFMLPF